MKEGVDKMSSKNPGLVCKVSLVNEKGELVLDTLVNYKIPTEVPKKKRQSKRVKKTEAIN